MARDLDSRKELTMHKRMEDEVHDDDFLSLEEEEHLAAAMKPEPPDVKG